MSDNFKSNNTTIRVFHIDDDVDTAKTEWTEHTHQFDPAWGQRSYWDPPKYELDRQLIHAAGSKTGFTTLNPKHMDNDDLVISEKNYMEKYCNSEKAFEETFNETFNSLKISKTALPNSGENSVIFVSNLIDQMPIPEPEQREIIFHILPAADAYEIQVNLDDLFQKAFLPATGGDIARAQRIYDKQLAWSVISHWKSTILKICGSLLALTQAPKLFTFLKSYILG